MRFLQLVGLLIGVFGLASCSSAPPPAAPWQPNFSNNTPIQLSVAQLAVLDNSSPTANQPVLRPDLRAAINAWQQQRLDAAGTDGQAVLLINRLVINQRQLPLRQDFSGSFTRQQREQWQVSLAAELRIQGNGGATQGFANASAERSTTLPEDATPAERQQAWNSLVAGLMQDFDQQLSNNIRQYLAAFVRN